MLWSEGANGLECGRLPPQTSRYGYRILVHSEIAGELHVKGLTGRAAHRARRVLHSTFLGVSYEVRRRFHPDRPVRKRVQGVELAMPRAHRLPDYAALYPGYGQNLVRVARTISRHDGNSMLQVVDIGANIGDSAIQIGAQVDALVLCVEGDRYWVPFLQMNTESRAEIRIEECFLTASPAQSSVEPVRSAGTTMFVPSEVSPSVRQRTMDQLLRDHPEFDRVRLLKSDTDGHDTRLVPAAAEALRSTHPVLFFEFDPTMTRRVGVDNPHEIWSALEASGYADFVLWDNFGNYLRTLKNSEVRAAAGHLDGPRKSRSYDYWDVAAIHQDDGDLTEAITRGEDLT